MSCKQFINVTQRENERKREIEIERWFKVNENQFQG